MIPFHFMSTCVICAGDGPGQEEILRRRYLVGLVGVATLVNRQEAGNYQAALMRDLTAAPGSRGPRWPLRIMPGAGFVWPGSWWRETGSNVIRATDQTMRTPASIRSTVGDNLIGPVKI